MIFLSKALQINISSISDMKKPTLQEIYERYCLVLAALTAVKNAPSWSGRRPSDKTIIEVFISTS